MAIAGLQNVSVLDSSFLRESRSRASRQQENDGRSSTRTSPLLQMWREFEDEHVSLLRGRFLWNDRIGEAERPASSAASELGFLRERHTVSDLREGFISRQDPSVCSQTSSSYSDTSSNADTNDNRNEKNHTNSSHETNGLIDQPEQNNGESNNHGLLDNEADLEHNIIQYTSWQEATGPVEEWHIQVPENRVCNSELQQSTTIQFSERVVAAEDSLGERSIENTENESLQETLDNGAADVTHLEEADEILHEQTQQTIEESSIQELIVISEMLEGDLVETTNQLESAVYNEEIDLRRTAIESVEQGEATSENMNHNLEENASNSWSQQLLATEYSQQHQPQEAPELENDVDGLQNWLEERSDQEVPLGRAVPFYLPDEDNGYSTELRELLTRRRVTSLLHSGFRESLNHLIQSYVERQNHASLDWELHETSSGARVDQDLEQQSGNQNEGEGVDENHLLGVPSPSVIPVPSLWDHEQRHDQWPPHDMHQRFGIEWEIINDLRIDMARLQQRMNNMQRMLEACMDMQLELQRSIKQEVSSALNRSAGSQGLSEDSFPKDDSRWDCIRKRICCMCCEANIDSLIYRCGHMCACSKCANELVQSRGKCPMCRAPAVEVIRAYSIL
ncbi:uncharacterized protein LOC110815550 [Carica papaya]|uniref:uncharacterized protein LOC110815550 n=1 Tax=Carica papaya TaxID=3649 RepID=UPI000B8C9C11|nr:uncharacterized protein LOC110815550 [Carica papaya]